MQIAIVRVAVYRRIADRLRFPRSFLARAEKRARERERESERERERERGEERGEEEKEGEIKRRKKKCESSISPHSVESGERGGAERRMRRSARSDSFAFVG